MREELKRIEALGAGGDVDELAAWLGHEDWQVRRAAVEAVVARALDPAARDAALGRLVAALHSEENAGLRSAAQEALSRVAPLAAPRLAREVAGAPDDVKILIAPVLGESGDAAAAPVLVELSRAADLNVATAGIVGLGRLRLREASGPLLELLRRRDPWLTFPAVEALGALGDARAAGPIAELLADPLLASTALEALVRIGGPAAAREIASRLFDGAGERGDLVDALVRVSRERLPLALARASREAAVAAFRERYRPDRFDALAAAARGGSAHAEAALEALGWTRDERALPVLLVALAKPATQAAAAAGLAVLLEEPALAALAHSLAARMPAGARLELARALSAAAPVEAARLLPDLLADADEEIWRDAAEVARDVAERLAAGPAIGEASARDAFDRVAGELDLLESEALGAATELLAQVAVAGGLDDALLDACAARLVEHPDLDARLAGAELQAVAGRLTPGARDALDEALHSPDPLARLRAVEIGAASGLPELRGLFERAVGDEEPLVRRSAVAALASFDDASAAEAVERAVGDRDDLVAADALDALAERGGERAAAALAEASHSERALLRCVAAERLAAVAGDGAAGRLLEMAASDPDFDVRRAAVASLGATAAARRAAEAALSDPHHAVRHAALRLVAAAPDPALAARVAEIADADDSEDARGEALVALAACAPEEALARVGRAALDPALAPYAVRALERVAARDPERVRRYRDEQAPPRAARAADAVLDARGERHGS